MADEAAVHRSCNTEDDIAIDVWLHTAKGNGKEQRGAPAQLEGLTDWRPCRGQPHWRLLVQCVPP